MSDANALASALHFARFVRTFVASYAQPYDQRDVDILEAYAKKIEDVLSEVQCR